MTLSLQQLRDELRDHIGVDSVEYPDATVDLLLNRAWWEIMAKFKFKESEVRTTWATVVGQADYTYAQVGVVLLEALKTVAIEDPNSFLHSDLDYMEPEVYESKFVNRTDAQAKPTNYTRLGTTVTLLPTPDLVYSMRTLAKVTLADIAAGGVTINQSWHEIILFGGIWRGFAKLGDWNRKQGAQSTQLGLMNSETPTEAKEKENVPLAGLRVLRTRYP